MPTPEPATPTAPRATADNAMEMWERSGGNKGMVDQLVCDWNEANPDKPINLSYIPHTEMVDKIAHGIATGDVPDLMGMDLIYAPQFENAGQLVDITDKIASWPELTTASPGHMTVATFNDRLYGVPLYADVSALFYNKDLFTKAGLDPNKPPTSLAELREYADKITALGGDTKGYYLPGNCAGCNIFTVGPLMWASDATIEAGKCGDEPLVGDGRQAGPPVRPRHGQGGQRPGQRPDRERRDVPPPVRLRQAGHDGHRQLQHHARPRADEGPRVRLRHQPACRAATRARPRRSSAATWSSSRTAASASTTPSTFMKFLLSDETQVEVYAKLLNLTTRSDMADNKYFAGRAARPGRRQGARRRPDAVHADVLRADQLAAGSVAADAPAGLLHRR